eukprot:m.36502 g.36502  ORF g.36502 m.36502 type:complete len:244 (-) comp12861_c0_seq1:1414-2145(-)
MSDTQLYLRSLSGKAVAVEFPVDNELSTLRQSIQDVEGIPADLQVLHHGGKLLGHRGRFSSVAGADIVMTMSLRGGGRGRSTHKGRMRQFTSGPNDEDAEKAEKKAAWNAKHGKTEDGEDDIDEEDEEEEGAASAKPKKNSKPAKAVKVDQYGIPITDSEGSSEEDEEEEEDAAAAAPVLTRREREEVEKQESDRKYQSLHAAGKTEESREDMARLKLIREKRAEAKEKREAMAAAKAAKSGR